MIYHLGTQPNHSFGGQLYHQGLLGASHLDLPVHTNSPQSHLQHIPKPAHRETRPRIHEYQEVG